MKRKTNQDISQKTKKQGIKKKRITTGDSLLFDSSRRSSPRIYEQTLQRSKGNRQIYTCLHYFLQKILPKDLIEIIFQYSKLLWDPYQFKYQDEMYIGFDLFIYSLSPIYVISLFNDMELNLWNLKEKTKENSLQLPDLLHFCFYPPHSIFILSANKLRIYDLYSLKESKSLSFPTLPATANTIVTVNRDNLFYVTAAVGSRLHVFDLKEEKLITQWDVEPDILSLFILSSNSNYLGTGYYSCLKIWNIQNHTCEFEIEKQSPAIFHENPIELNKNYIAFSSNPCFFQSYIEIWDMKTKKCLFEQKTSSIICIMKVTEEYFITYSRWGKNLNIYQSENFKLIKALKFKKELRSCVKNDRNQILILLGDGTLQVWESEF